MYPEHIVEGEGEQVANPVSITKTKESERIRSLMVNYISGDTSKHVLRYGSFLSTAFLCVFLPP